MPQKLATGAGRQALSFHEGVVGDGSTKCFAPADALLHSLAGRGDGHRVEPPTLFRGQRLPVAKRVRDVSGGLPRRPSRGCRVPCRGTDALARAWQGSSGTWRQASRWPEAAICLLPKRWRKRQPPVRSMSTRNDGSLGDGASTSGTQMVELVAPVLADADHVTAAAALGDVDQKAMPGLIRKEAETDNISGEGIERARHPYWVTLVALNG